MAAEIAAHVMDEADARRLTEKIRITAHTYTEAREKLIGYVEEAKVGSAHVALGYASWTAYLSEVLGEEPMRLARDERREVVHLLSSEGMSTRAIASVVGAGQSTVSDDLRSGDRNRSPVPLYRQQPETKPGPTPPFDPATGEVLDGGGHRWTSDDERFFDAADRAVRHEPTGRTLGNDGKSYPKAAPRKERRTPLADTFFSVTVDLTKKVESLTRLVSDDRFTQNAEKVATANRSDLLRAIDALERIVDRLPSQN